MRNLDKEKLKALDELNKEDKLIVNKENIETTYIDGIRTVKRVPQDYKDIWNAFLKIEPEFKSYMGYGKEDILKIGIKKFIDFTDIRSVSELDFYKKDRVKAIPCCHCKKNFTTFQMDSGLCQSCVKHYDLDKFNQMCENENEASVIDLLSLFVYNDSFRTMFKKNRDSYAEITDCIVCDNFSGFYTKEILTKYISLNKTKELKKALVEFKEKNILSDILKFKINTVLSMIANETISEESITEIVNHQNN